MRPAYVKYEWDSPILLVKGERTHIACEVRVQKNINTSAKYISTPCVNPFTRSENESVNVVGVSVWFITLSGVW